MLRLSHIWLLTLNLNTLCWPRPMHEHLTVKNNTVIQRMTPLPGWFPWGPGLMAVQTASQGDPWQPGIDIYNEAFTHFLLHPCQQEVDGNSFLRSDLRHKLGPLPLENGQFITYEFKFRRGAFYNDILNIFTWAIYPNYRMQAQQNGLSTTWATWDPRQNTRVATPWLRTPLYVIEAWSRVSQGRGDIGIMINVTSSLNPRAAAEVLKDFTGKDPDSQEIRIARADVCLPDLWTTDYDEKYGPIAEAFYPNWALAARNMFHNSTAAAQQQVGAASQTVEAIFQNGTSLDTRLNDSAP